MNAIVKWGLILGVAVEIWTYIWGFTGLYRTPTGAMIIVPLFILTQIVVLVLGLRHTAHQGRSYWPQVGAGTAMSLVAAAVIFVGAMLFTTVVFPEYFAEVRAAGEELMRAQGASEDQIAHRLGAPGSQSSLANALAGAVGTIITGFVVSLVIAIFVRQRA
ncbi:MAG: DUF4199 domain-containing protein [Acidobacteriota bacterium]|nr:MAG: DUF4199 domain-containing protein [Acidobacteriota bacterium]